MSVSLMEGVAAAVPPEAPAQEPKAGSMTAAADIPSAKVAAKLSGHRVEALSERTETSTTWVNQDGSLTTELSAGPFRSSSATATGSTSTWTCASRATASRRSPTPAGETRGPDRQARRVAQGGAADRGRRSRDPGRRR
ncbi:hypothetical protein SGLAM104S_09356 [Streptomyces glaucescens]